MNTENKIVTPKVEETKQVKTGYIKATPKQQEPTQFVMVKNTVGSLAVDIEPHDFSSPKRTVYFKHNQDKTFIPTKWAIEVFVTQSAIRQLEMGYFTFENLDILIKMAEAQGYYVPESIKNPQLTIKEIVAALQKGDEKGLERITNVLTTKTRQDIISVAQKIYDTLSISTVKFLEKKLQASLKPVNLDA